MTKEIILRASNNAELIADFKTLEDWEAFEVIANTIIEKLNAQVKEKLDGPDARVWVFRVNDIDFSLHNNPYGNYLMATTEPSKEILKQIAANWHIW